MLSMLTLLIAVVAMITPMAMSYDEKYDKVDLNKILGDETLFTAYISCMLDKGPCDVEYSEDFKKLLPEVIATSCAKCSDFQQQNVRKMVKAIQERKPDEFVQFREKYDPKGVHEKDFLNFVLGSD